MPNIFGGAGLREEVNQLRAEGIEVDDNKEPLPEDAEPTPPDPEGMQYEYTIPTFALSGQIMTSSTVLGGGQNIVGMR